jgi:predicted small lipoprotein YifL
MSKLFTTLTVALLVVSLVGCSLAPFPIPEVSVTPSPSTEDSQACDRVAYEAGTSRPPVMSHWLIIPEVLLWPISEVVFLPLMVAMSKNPNESDRAQLETWKKPYIQCLTAKGYKSQ